MSRPAPTVIPLISYRDAASALAFLRDAFGFDVVVDDRDGDEVVHAELTLGDGMVMVSGDAHAESAGFAGHVGQEWIYVVVDDPDAHHARARAAGATVVRGLEDRDFGSRDYSARDPEENLWTFGTYRPVM